MKKFNISYIVVADSIAEALGQLAYPDGEINEGIYDEISVYEVKEA